MQDKIKSFKDSVWFKPILTLLVLGFVLGFMVSGFVIYKKFLEPTYDTFFYFNFLSELPEGLEDYNALMDYPGYIGSKSNASILNGGQEYTVSVSVSSEEAMSYEYMVLFDSGIYRKAFSNVVEPGETWSLNASFTPGLEDKWVLDYVKNESYSKRIRLSTDAFLGERIVPVIVSGGRLLTPSDYPGKVEYGPIRLSVPGLGSVLNLNLSLDELSEKPYRYNISDVDEGKFSLTESNNYFSISREGDDLVVGSFSTNKYFVSKPASFRIYIYREGTPLLHKTLRFNYIIK